MIRRTSALLALAAKTAVIAVAAFAFSFTPAQADDQDCGICNPPPDCWPEDPCEEES